MSSRRVLAVACTLHISNTVLTLQVAAVTGDLRKAMDLLRRAIEIAIEGGAKKLLVEHVSFAVFSFMSKQNDWSITECSVGTLCYARGFFNLAGSLCKVLVKAFSPPFQSCCLSCKFVHYGFLTAIKKRNF